MKWKEILRKLERDKEWDTAIEFMVDYLDKNSEDLDGYLSMCYLLMNLLVEEDYDRSKRDYYAKLLKRYFDESYFKFSHNPEYLYFIGRIAAMSEWYFDIEWEEVEAMIKDAARLDPNNLIYQWTKYYTLSRKIPISKDVIEYTKLVLKEDSSIKQTLMTKGSLGEYIYDMMSNWASKVLTGKHPYK